MSLTDQALKRGCYCGTWDTNPQAFEALGLPRGYCGMCQVCGRPGHMRHFPGLMAYTGAWCDRHWWRAVWLDPRASVGCLVWLVGLGLVVMVLWWFRASVGRAMPAKLQEDRRNRLLF